MTSHGSHKHGLSVLAALSALLASATMITPSRAGPVADAVAEAEALLPAGSTAAIWEEFDRATELFWADAPLAFRRALLVDSASGFGQYQPRVAAMFHAGDSLVVYLEPVGYGWTAIGDQFRIRFGVDIEIASTGNGIIIAEPGFATVERLSRTRNWEFQLTLEMTLPDLPADAYELRITLHDAATGKTAGTAIPFEVAL